jgi:hypothetical protein
MYRNTKLKNTGKIVSRLFTDHPDWNATQIYNSYVEDVGKDNAVTLNAVQKHVEELRRKHKEQKLRDPDFDKPCNLGFLIKKYGDKLDAESILQVALVIKTFVDHKTLKYMTLSNRKALWIAKLHRLVTYVYDPTWEYGIMLYFVAEKYAWLELYCEITGETFSTTALDIALLSKRGIASFSEEWEKINDKAVDGYYQILKENHAVFDEEDEEKKEDGGTQRKAQ